MTRVAFADVDEHHTKTVFTSQELLAGAANLHFGILKNHRIYRLDFAVDDPNVTISPQCRALTVHVDPFGEQKNHFAVRLETVVPGNLKEAFDVEVVSQDGEKKMISVQIEATVMSVRTGTPMLREGVRQVGRGSGCESDEETEWPGFHPR